MNILIINCIFINFNKFSVFQNSRMLNANQTLGANNNNSGIFTASPLQSQRTSSPIKMSPTHHQEDLIYGNATIPSPYRRYKKTL